MSERPAAQPNRSKSSRRAKNLKFSNTSSARLHRTPPATLMLHSARQCSLPAPTANSCNINEIQRCHPPLGYKSYTNYTKSVAAPAATKRRGPRRPAKAPRQRGPV
jgi:hypothetical protein